MDATDSLLPASRFPGAPGSSRLRPMVSPDAEPFFEALRERRLVLQTCLACAQARWPCAPACPHCGSTAPADWRAASGRGRVHSLARYHKAFLSEFDGLLPYTVLNVALDEGPRLIGRWLGRREAVIGMPVRVAVEYWDDGLHVPAFGEAAS